MPNKRYLFTLLVLTIGVISCTHVHPSSVSRPQYRSDGAEHFFSYLNKAIEKSGGHNAYYHTVPGFPYLRTTRFLASLKAELNSPIKKKIWLRWLMEAGSRARESEIGNLPASALRDISALLNEPMDKQSLINKAEAFSKTMMQTDLKEPTYFDTLKAVVSYPDEYSSFTKIIGLYPITSVPVAALTIKVRKEFLEWYEGPVENLTTKGRLTAYAPITPMNPSMKKIHLIIAESRDNPFNVPVLSTDQEKLLAKAYAPNLFQDVSKNDDKIGRVEWNNDILLVNTKKPTLYYYVSHASFKGKPALQINYVSWYPSRFGPDAPLIERGRLDGLTLRITFDDAGEPVMVDGMNNCGCYHFFIPNKKSLNTIIAKPMKPDPFVPQFLPETFPEQRLGIRINSGWHQVQRIITSQPPQDSVSYELAPYHVLESLPRLNGARTHPHESIFDSKGIVKGSGRIEPILLFSMGIHDIGSMRQRGHHAVSFFENSHFDDPDFIGNNFIFK